VTALNAKPANRTSIVNSRMLRALESVSVLGVVLFVFAASFAPFDSLTDINLPLHMLQHVLIAIGGVMIGYSAYKSGRLDKFKSARNGLLGFSLLSALIVLWHLPFFWDAAVLSLYVHVTEHLCFFSIGIMIGIFIPMLPDNIKVITVVLAISSHMFYGFALYIATTPIYPLYPLNQQSELGLALFAPSPIYLIGYLYFSLTKESRRLEQEDAESGLLMSPTLTPQSIARRNANGTSVSRMLVLVLSIVMIVSLLGYYGYTAAAISVPVVAPSPHDSYIYIEEGPVSWQYSPQHMTVVLGQNNTVTWISHSYSEDTVTSANNTFASHILAPGQSFTYEFTQPGTYVYYCKFHLWMTGTIIVLSSTSSK